MNKIAIRGWIELPSPQFFDGAVAIVGLDDVTLVDAPSQRLAETVIEGVRGRQERIPFGLEVDRNFPPSGSYVLAAEIRCSGENRLRPGDFLTTVAVPWIEPRSDATEGNVVPVKRV